jgi:hypothetical protein
LKLARLMSCLHANALDFIAGDEAYARQKCLGVAGLDQETLKLMNVCEDETLLYVLVQWIQQMILYNLGTGVIPTPPPIVSRVFQDLSQGVVTLNNVRKISETPFPFPYAQTLSTLIVLHAAITPLVFAIWTENEYWAALFTFTAVFLFSTINFIAAEIEQPFGDDANDIVLADLQSKFNNILVTMLSPQCTQRPMLKKKPGDLKQELKEMIDTAETCMEAWERAEVELGSGMNRSTARTNNLDEVLNLDHAHEKAEGTSHKVSPPGQEKEHVQTTVLEQTKAPTKSPEKNTSATPASKDEQPTLPALDAVFLDDGFKRCTNIRIASRRHIPETCDLQCDFGCNDKMQGVRLKEGTSTNTATPPVTGPNSKRDPNLGNDRRNDKAGHKTDGEFSTKHLIS